MLNDLTVNNIKRMKITPRINKRNLIFEQPQKYCVPHQKFNTFLVGMLSMNVTKQPIKPPNTDYLLFTPDSGRSFIRNPKNSFFTLVHTSKFSVFNATFKTMSFVSQLHYTSGSWFNFERHFL